MASVPINGGSHLVTTRGEAPGGPGIGELGAFLRVRRAALQPSVTRADDAPPLRSQLAALRRGQVLLSLLLTVLVFGGLIGAFMYVEPLTTRVTGYPASAMPWLLVIFGVGLFAGNLVGGRAADRNLDRTLIILAVLLPMTLVCYALLAPFKIGIAVALFVIGFVGFATAPPLQVRVVRYAGDAPTIASAANIAAFNLGNAIGVFLAGSAIDAGFGWASPAWVGAGMATVGMIAVLVGTARRTKIN